MGRSIEHPLGKLHAVISVISCQHRMEMTVLNGFAPVSSLNVKGNRLPELC